MMDENYSFGVFYGFRGKRSCSMFEIYGVFSEWLFGYYCFIFI